MNTPAVAIDCVAHLRMKFNADQRYALRQANDRERSVLEYEFRIRTVTALSLIAVKEPPMIGIMEPV